MKRLPFVRGGAPVVLVLLVAVASFVLGLWNTLHAQGLAPAPGVDTQRVATAMAGVALLLVAVALAAVVDLARRRDLATSPKLLWIAVVVVVPGASVAYFILGRTRTRIICRDLGLQVATDAS